MGKKASYWILLLSIAILAVSRSSFAIGVLDPKVIKKSGIMGQGSKSNSPDSGQNLCGEVLKKVRVMEGTLVGEQPECSAYLALTKKLEWYQSTVQALKDACEGVSDGKPNCRQHAAVMAVMISLKVFQSLISSFQASR